MARKDDSNDRRQGQADASPTHFVTRPTLFPLSSIAPQLLFFALKLRHQSSNSTQANPLNRFPMSSYTFLVLCTALVSVQALYGDGSCKEARLCCPGRDASCSVHKLKSNEIADDLIDRVCYCDSACTSVGDCCFDYEQTCGGKLKGMF